MSEEPKSLISQSRPRPTSALQSSARWQPPSWLDEWLPAEPVPVDGPTLLAEIVRAERATEPASEEVAAAALAETILLFPRPDHWATTSKFYLEALAGVPADLVAAALKHVRLTSKFFPKPAEIRKPIEDELAARNSALLKLRLADKMRRRQTEPRVFRPPTDEEKARVSEMVDAAVRRMRGAE